ncbi:hypothetical protein C8D72_2938 [Kushneria indalinina DSM 14324]|uniref:Uncharacterized protein n=1 Tax=Kushneria indalinina DSM 14324 TaxID=1122140 RepID=A0A3D9DSD1_9GAMM|nr:hypothetical protein C8D72_2938 [Kushneria indalinina DSM 14324]
MGPAYSDSQNKNAHSKVGAMHNMMTCHQRLAFAARQACSFL